MWEESWSNLMMQMRDLPYYKYNSKPGPGKKGHDEDAIPGTIEHLKKHFGKYIEK